MNIIKNLKKNTIFLLFITIIILYIILKDDFSHIINAFKNINILYIIIAVIVFFIHIALKGYVNYLITNDSKKISIQEAIKHNLITQFFNGITPFSTGGQPMEIYMLTEHGISIPKATNQTIQSFIFYQIALVICGLLAVIYNFLFSIFPKIKILSNLVILGFSINISVVIVLILISHSKIIMNKICNITIKIGKKIKIKSSEAEIKEKFLEYHEGFKEIKKRKLLFVVGIIFNIISLLCLYSIPLLVLKSINPTNNMSIIETITSSAYVYVIGSFVPIPGASGGIEYGFTQFYGNFISKKELSAVLLIWRFITYYFGIIIGAILFNFDKKVKN